MRGVSYALDRLGWLQFQQLCAHVLELEAGVPPDAWQGDADGTRIADAWTAGWGRRCLPSPVPDRVLVQCAWLPPESRWQPVRDGPRAARPSSNSTICAACTRTF